MSFVMKKLRHMIVCLVVLCMASASSLAFADQHSIDADAVSAYREGDLDTARTLWIELLEQEPAVLRGAERARVLFNLGNLAVRAQDDLEAVGWYSASLRLRPRDRAAWKNLEFARLNSELEEADRGDLRDTLAHLLGSLTPGESRSLALLALLPLAIAFAFEALRGGLFWRLACLAGLLLAIAGAIPLGYSLATAQVDPVMVIEKKGLPARAEPRDDAKRVVLLEAGESYERVNSYPEWVQVRLGAGRLGWVRDTGVFALDR